MFTPPNMSPVTCQVSLVICHVSHVTCQVSYVMSLFFLFFFGQSDEAYWWRICYQQGLPHLIYRLLRKLLRLGRLLQAVGRPYYQLFPYFHAECFLIFFLISCLEVTLMAQKPVSITFVHCRLKVEMKINFSNLLCLIYNFFKTDFRCSS